MKIKRGAPAAILAGIVAASVLVLAPAAAGFDPLELPAAIDAANTYSADPLSAPTNDGSHDFAVGGGQHGASFIGPCSNSFGGCVNEGFSAQSGPSGESPQGHVS